MKKISALFAFLLVVTILDGQYDPKENFYDAEFFLAEEDYSEALYAFTQVYNDGYQDNANINYRIGLCLLQIDGRKTESIPYLEKAVKNINLKYSEGSFKETGAPTESFLLLANAYRIKNKFETALEYYNKFMQYAGEGSPQALYTELQIEACNSAKEAMKNKETFTVGTLGQVNAIRVPVYNPAVSGDLNTFAFMGRQKFYNGIYISRKEEGKWTRPYNITPSIQSDGNQEVLCLSYDGNKLLVSWFDDFESDIWITEYRNGRWYKSEPLPKPINSKYYESHACFTPDGNTIYFSSNRKESIGEMDIFRVTMNEDGSWGEVELLGAQVNSVLNDDYPFVSSDGKRLYFSSQGHSGLGGFDVFYCDIKEDGSLGEAVNLGYPLNTTDDDNTFLPRKILYDGSLTMFAKGEAEQVDIFRFQWIPESASPVIVAFETTAPEVIEELAEEVTQEEVTEEITEVLAEAETKELAEEVPEEIAEEITTPETQGEATEEVAGVLTQESTEEAVIEEVAETVEEVESETYLLKPVYFDFDSYALSSVALQKLDGIAAIMKRFPTLVLQITGHTDAVGTDSYNLILAKNRANAVAKYLNSKGIEESRLSVESKGESEPVALNRTLDNRDAPRGRALNRRVHFKASVAGGVLVEVEEIEVPEDLKIKN